MMMMMNEEDWRREWKREDLGLNLDWNWTGLNWTGLDWSQLNQM
jgi:hypothetical protein